MKSPRAKKAATPGKPQGVPSQPATPYTFPAPIRGWVQNENLAAAQPAGAAVLDNWVCTTTGIRVRSGRSRYATLGAPVSSMFVYRSTSQAMFAATATGIFNVSLVTNPNTVQTPVVTGLAGGEWSTVQFGTAGGDFLVAANGADTVRLFNGTTWSVAAITGVVTSLLSHVWTFANRLWFVERDSLSVWYLPIDSIGGAALEFPMGAIFGKGGSLLFGATWSMDAGDGLDDKCVFVTTEGEVAIYEGTNPSSAADWRLVGRYDMPKPMGKAAVVGAGGDLLIATAVGMIPISAAVNSDLGAIETKAVSAPIRPHWQRQVLNSPGGWQAQKFTEQEYMIVSSRNGSDCMVINLVTGGWSRFTGWDVRCMAEFGNRGFMGSLDGRIYRMESGASDDGAIYTAAYLAQHDALQAYGATKTVKQIRPTFRFSTPFAPMVSATADFSLTLGAPPPVLAGAPSGDLWDLGRWDLAVWDTVAGQSTTQSLWSSVGITGTFIAPEVQISIGGLLEPDIDLVSCDVMFTVGAGVT